MFGLSIPPTWLTIAAGCCTVALGIAYFLQTRSIVHDFKLVLVSHRRILSMALVSQGLAHCFIGAVILLIAFWGPPSGFAKALSTACAVMLLVLAVWTGSSGARSEYFLLRVSHFVNIVAAALLMLGQLPE
jgi:hypothetical protein